MAPVSSSNTQSSFKDTVSSEDFSSTGFGLTFPIVNVAVRFTFWFSLKSFCLKDRGRLGNEGRPISLKIGTQSTYVRLFFSRVLDISPSGGPRG